MKSSFVLFASLLLVACQSTESTRFPPGLEPLEPDNVAAPAPTGTDPYPETLALDQGMDDVSNYVHATGYVHGSVAEVWAAMQDPTVVVDRRKVSAYTATLDVEPEYDTSFVTHYTINQVVTVQFDVTWRMGVVSGSTTAPTQVSAVYQKTVGSSFIMMMHGSVELEEIAPGVTRLSYAQRMNAVSTSSMDIATWTMDMFTSIVARVHGQPLPTYG